MEEKDKEMLEFMITAMLADYDLMGLIINYNRPATEYSPEARSIVRFIEKENYNVKLDVLAERIRYIFLCWFDIQPEFGPCVMIANEIKKML